MLTIAIASSVAPLLQGALPSGIIATVNQFTDFLLGYLLALAAIGALAMALIEAWKKVFDSGTKFRAKRFTAWVSKSLKEGPLEAERDHASAAIADVLQLCTGVTRAEAERAAERLDDKHGALPLFHAFTPSPAHAVFTLDVDRMMGALQDATDTALNSPQRYRALYAFAAAGGDDKDVAQWLTDAETGLTGLKLGDDMNAAERRTVKEYTDRAARLRQVVKRKLDAFQLLTTERWASYNQTAAVVVGGLLMYGVLTWMRASQSDGAPSAFAIIPLSMLGGILSPVAKDLVTSLKRVRSG